MPDNVGPRHRTQRALKIAAAAVLLVIVAGIAFERFRRGAHLVVAELPVIGGKPESCVACHKDVPGLGVVHDTKTMGCFACHAGDPLGLDAETAHRGMVLVAGNLDTVDVTCGRCHVELSKKVRMSLMATARGLVSVDRFIFGEQATPDGLTSISELGTSAADSHLKQLCSSCHLGYTKSVPAPTSELSRGGGCVACHLADETPRGDVRKSPEAFMHPGITLKVRNESCFGCHSRSGRVSLSYAGWSETTEGETSSLPKESVRRLDDGRIARRQQADVHHEHGMACIDCHTAQETMGDGKVHAHEEEATHVRCTTCHRPSAGPRARTVALASLDSVSALVVAFRDGANAAAEYLVEDRSGEPLTNARPLPDGTVEVRGKLDGKRHIATKPAPACETKGHDRVSCQACHSSWVPRCIGCHTQLEAEGGEWVEYDVPPRIGWPTLGVMERDGSDVVEPFVPGMVLTINASPGEGRLSDDAKELVGPHTRFVRAYAFAAPHTTTKTGRSCESCHLDPVALGYGEGRLVLDDNRWRFEPRLEASRFDGLPADAWIGVLGKPGGGTATRTTARALNVDEQRRTLDVGACMTCHAPGSEQDRGIYRDFRASVGRMTAACRRPRY